MRRFREHHARRGCHPFKLAAPCNQVEIGFENLWFRPALLDRDRRAHLPQLLRDRSPMTTATDRRIDQRRELHRDRAGTARTTAYTAVQHRARNRAQIDPVMIVEAAIL